MFALASLAALAAPPSSPVLADRAFADVADGKPLHAKDRGSAVETLQAVLTIWNYCETTPCRSGKYDEATESAVRSFELDRGREDADGDFDAQDLAAMDERLNAAVYAPIRAAGSKGFRYDVPVKANLRGDDVRLAVIRTAVVGADAKAVLSAHLAMFASIPRPTPEQEAAGRMEVWLPVEVVHELLR